jgi:hypothetical protein
VGVAGIAVEVRPALGAQARALRPAHDLLGQGEHERLVGPAVQVQLLEAVQVRALELLAAAGWETSRASTWYVGLAGSRQRMHGPSSPASKRRRRA